MKVPVEWLTELCDPGWSPEEVAERLSMSGTEVERVSAPAPELGPKFVVGSVLAVEPHPDADRLRVCRVDAGGERTIVCGAPNVAEGQRVAVALPGARLPDGTKLRKAKLRGVASEGMILSEAEMGLGSEGEGIVVLDGNLEPGSKLADALGAPAQALELEVTTNRPDCLSVYGVARELHAVSGSRLAEAPWEGDAVKGSAPPTAGLVDLDVAVPGLCSRFALRAFSEVRVGPSPEWLRERLLAAGLRPINNVVDVTNYVMLATGEPLHAFDLDELAGPKLHVRVVREGESLLCLDGVDRELPAGSVVICDDDGPVSIAGVIGGEASQVSPKTSRVLLETATWDGASVLRTSRALSLRTEASARFEKGLHPALCGRAQAMASRLLAEICEAQPAEDVLEFYPEPPEPRRLSLRPERASDLVGMEIPASACTERLEALGFGVSGPDEGGALAVEVPPERDADCRREVDLIEEVARLGDLDRCLPATLPGVASAGGLTDAQLLRRRSEDLLRDSGFSEIVAWSFTSASVADALGLPPGHVARNAIAIANPLASDQAVMRTLLLGGLLDASRVSANHGAEGIRLFESGRVYMPSAPEPPRGSGPEAGDFVGLRDSPAREEHRLAALMVGPQSRAWRADPVPPDFFAAKGVLEGLLEALCVEASFEQLDEPFLCPGRAAAVVVDGLTCGWVGEPHPRVLEGWSIPGAAGFEVALAPILDAALANGGRYTEPPSHPPVLEDLSVLVSGSTTSTEVLSAVRGAGSDLLAGVEVVDVYESEGLGANRRSLTLRLVFRATERTLTDSEVADARSAIVTALESLGGEVRG